MPGCFLSVRHGYALAWLLAASNPHAGAQGDGIAGRPPQKTESLEYNIEWRLIDAGRAQLKLAAIDGRTAPHWQASIHLESAGLVSKLYKLSDNYTVQFEDPFCATSTSLDAFEGKKHRDTRVVYDRAHEKASYIERDLIKNTTVAAKETPIPSCVADVITGLFKLRNAHLEPGQSIQIPTSDGKKTAPVRIEAQEREEIKNKLGNFKTIRYEAFLFNGVIYSKKARMFVWLTDDARRLPVQIRARMPFPIGNITLELEKEEHL
jgi:hypothetical protein